METPPKPNYDLLQLFEQVQIDGGDSILPNKAIHIIKENFSESSKLLYQLLGHLHTSKLQISQAKPIISLLTDIYQGVFRIANNHSSKCRISIEQLKEFAAHIFDIHIKAFECIPTQRHISLTLIKSAFHSCPKILITQTLFDKITETAIMAFKSNSSFNKINSLFISEVGFIYKEFQVDKLMSVALKCLHFPNEMVRKKAILSIPITYQNVDKFIKRAKDSSILIRCELFKKFTKQKYFFKLSVAQRIELTYYGLSDVNETVRQCCKEYLSKSTQRNQETVSISSSCRDNMLKWTSPIKNKEEISNFNPAEFLSYFEVRRILSDYNFYDLFQLLVEYLIDIIDAISLFAYIRDNIIGGLSEIVGEKKKLSSIEVRSTPQDIGKLAKLEDENLCFLYYVVKIWTIQKDNRQVTNIDDIMFEHSVYMKLFSRYEQRDDYFLLYHLLPFVERIKESDNRISADILKKYYEFLLRTGANNVCKNINFEKEKKNPMSITTLLHICSGKVIIQGMNDLVKPLTREIIYLMRKDNEDLFNEFKLKLSDITESIEIEQKEESKFAQIEGISKLMQECMSGISSLKTLLLAHQNDADIIAGISEKEREYDQLIATLVATKKDIFYSITKALIFAYSFFFWSKVYRYEIKLSEIVECKNKLLQTSYEATKWISEGDAIEIKVYEMQLLNMTISYDSSLFAESSEVLCSGIAKCTCDPTPCSIAIAMGIHDLLIAFPQDKFSNIVNERIVKMNEELVNMAYSTNLDIAYIGLCNIIKFILYSTNCDTVDLIIRLMERSLYFSDENSRINNLLDSFYEEYGTQDNGCYKMLLRCLYLFVLVCAGSLGVPESEGSLLNLFAVESIHRTCISVITRLSIAHDRLVKKSKQFAAPFYKFIYSISLMSSRYSNNKFFQNVLLSVIQAKELHTGTTMGSQYKVYKLLKNIPIYKNNKIIQKYMQRLSTKIDSKGSKSKEKLKEYMINTETEISKLIKSAANICNMYLNHDIQCINQPFNEAPKSKIPEQLFTQEQYQKILAHEETKSRHSSKRKKGNINIELESFKTIKA